MINEMDFTLKQIVWAKVPDYPWWPARVFLPSSRLLTDSQPPNPIFIRCISLVTQLSNCPSNVAAFYSLSIFAILTTSSSEHSHRRNASNFWKNLSNWQKRLIIKVKGALLKLLKICLHSHQFQAQTKYFNRAN